MRHYALPRSALVVLAAGAALLPAVRLSAAEPAAHTSFEGIWLPQDMPPGGGGGPPGGAGGPPGGGPGVGGPPGAGPGGAVGGPGAPANQDQVVNCAPLPRLDGGGGGDSDLIVQGPTEIVLLSEEWMDAARKIYLDGKHPAHVKPQPNGHSVGHWEGATLVVDTVGYADSNGNDLGQHVVERWTREGEKITSHATVTDKSGKSSERTLTWVKEAGLQFNESVCEEAFDRFQYVDGKLVDTNTSDAGADK